MLQSNSPFTIAGVQYLVFYFLLLDLSLQLPYLCSQFANYIEGQFPSAFSIISACLLCEIGSTRSSQSRFWISRSSDKDYLHIAVGVWLISVISQCLLRRETIEVANLYCAANFQHRFRQRESLFSVPAFCGITSSLCKGGNPKAKPLIAV